MPKTPKPAKLRDEDLDTGTFHIKTAAPSERVMRLFSSKQTEKKPVKRSRGR